MQVIYGAGSNNISEKKQYWGSPAGQAVVPWWCNTHRGSCCVWALRVTVSGIPHLISHRSTPVILRLTPIEATRWPGSQNCTKTQLYPDYSLVKSPTQSHMQSRFIHQFSNCCSFWMQDHTQTNYGSVAVCIGNDTMISLDISHIYGALFIDLPKVSDTVDRTFLLQQFKRDTDFTVAWFSSNIIGHWVLWGSWHCCICAAKKDVLSHTHTHSWTSIICKCSLFTGHNSRDSHEKSVINTATCILQWKTSTDGSLGQWWTTAVLNTPSGLLILNNLRVQVSSIIFQTYPEHVNIAQKLEFLCL